MNKTIDHLSYSACRTFLTSPSKFEKCYINGEQLPFPLVMAEGKAWHKGLEMFFTRPENYIGDALQELTDTKDEIQDFDEEEFQIVGERLEENLIV